MSGGRPTTYSDEMLALTWEYIDACQDQITEGKLKVKLPTVEGLSIYLGVTRSTVYLWAETHKEFSDTLEHLKAKQAEMLISQGLANNDSSTIAKLMLSSNHGMREKSDVTTDGKEMPSPIINLNEILRNNSTEEAG